MCFIWNYDKSVTGWRRSSLHAQMMPRHSRALWKSACSLPSFLKSWGFENISDSADSSMCPISTCIIYPASYIYHLTGFKVTFRLELESLPLKSLLQKTAPRFFTHSSLYSLVSMATLPTGQGITPLAGHDPNPFLLVELCTTWWTDIDEKASWLLN